MIPGPAHVAAAPFNVSEYLLDRHVRAGRGDRIALTGAAGKMSYAELTERVRRAAAGLRGLGPQPEQRVVIEAVLPYPQLRQAGRWPQILTRTELLQALVLSKWSGMIHIRVPCFSRGQHPAATA